MGRPRRRSWRISSTGAAIASAGQALYRIGSRVASGGGGKPPSPPNSPRFKVRKRRGRRQKTKHNRTWTKTRTKTQEHSQATDLKDSVESASRLFQIGRPKPPFGKIVARFKWTDSFNLNITQIAGLQNFQVINESVNIPQLTSAGQPSDFYRTAAPLFYLNPNENTTGSGLYSAVTTPTSDRIHITNVNNHYTFCNFENVPVYLDVYTFLAKKESRNDPVQMWKNILSFEGAGKSIFSASGSGTSGGAAVGYGSNVVPFAKPMSHREFNKVWKCMGVSHFQLAAGSEICYSQELVYNRPVDYAYVSQLTTTDAPQRYLSGYTVVTCVMVRGGLVDDQTAVNGGNPTFGPVKVGCVINRTYNLRALDIAKRTSTGVVFIQPPTGGANAVLKHVDFNDALAAVVQA